MADNTTAGAPVATDAPIATGNMIVADRRTVRCTHTSSSCTDAVLKRLDALIALEPAQSSEWYCCSVLRERERYRVVLIRAGSPLVALRRFVLWDIDARDDLCEYFTRHPEDPRLNEIAGGHAKHGIINIYSVANGALEVLDCSCTGIKAAKN